jgi:O-antigen/teichoic acid export membrane protein
MSLRTQTLWSILPLLAVTVVNIVSVPLFYSYLGAENYALWFYVLTLTGSFGFMDVGLGVAAGRFIGAALGRRDLGAVKQYWGTANVIAIPLLLVMAVGFSTVGILFGPKWFQVRPGDVLLLRWLFAVAGPGLFLSYYGQFWNILGQAYLDFRFLAVVRTLLALAGIAVALPLAWKTGNPLLIVLWSTAVSALQLGIYVWHAGKTYGMGFNLKDWRLHRAREMAAYTAKTFIGLLVSSVSGAMDRMILGRIVSGTEFANYNIGTNAGLRMQSLGASILGPVFHQSNRAIADSDTAEIRRIHREAFSLVFGWCVLPVIVVWIWRDSLLRLWLGRDLSLMVAPIFLPVVLAAAVQVTFSISAAQLSSLDRQGSVVMTQAFGIVLSVVGGLIGWRSSGLSGFAWGIAFSRLAGFVQDILLMRIVGRLGWLTGVAARIIAVQVAISIPPFVMSRFISDWRISAAVGITHTLIGSIPLINQWLRGFIPQCGSQR